MARVMLYHRISRPALLAAATIATVTVFAATPLRAQDTAQAPQAAPAPSASDDKADDDLHDPRRDSSGQIVVSAKGLKQLDVLAGTSVLAAEELQRNQAGQIGEVLSKLPGVTASGFSPAASRPILRGFSGERV